MILKGMMDERNSFRSLYQLIIFHKLQTNDASVATDPGL